MQSDDLKKLKKATQLLKCMAHPLRLSLLGHLSEGHELSAGELVARERRSAGQSQISQYLGQLRRLGLVKTRRKGQVIYYRLTSNTVKNLFKVLYKLYCGKG